MTTIHEIGPILAHPKVLWSIIKDPPQKRDAQALRHEQEIRVLIHRYGPRSGLLCLYHFEHVISLISSLRWDLAAGELLARKQEIWSLRRKYFR